MIWRKALKGGVDRQGEGVDSGNRGGSVRNARDGLKTGSKARNGRG